MDRKRSRYEHMQHAMQVVSILSKCQWLPHGWKHTFSCTTQDDGTTILRMAYRHDSMVVTIGGVTSQIRTNLVVMGSVLPCTLDASAVDKNDVLFRLSQSIVFDMEKQELNFLENMYRHFIRKEKETQTLTRKWYAMTKPQQKSRPKCSICRTKEIAKCDICQAIDSNEKQQEIKKQLALKDEKVRYELTQKQVVNQIRSDFQDMLNQVKHKYDCV